MPPVQNSDNGETERSEVDAEVEQIVDTIVDTGKSWISRMSNDVSKSSVAKQVKYMYCFEIDTEMQY